MNCETDTRLLTMDYELALNMCVHGGRNVVTLCKRSRWLDKFCGFVEFTTTQEKRQTNSTTSMSLP